VDSVWQKQGVELKLHDVLRDASAQQPAAWLVLLVAAAVLQQHSPCCLAQTLGIYT
jgi:hypothetical protein